MDIHLIPIIFLSFLSYLSLAFAGFGGILVPITLGASFYSIEWMLSVLVPVSLLSNLVILLRHYRNIDFNLLFRKILPFMGMGLVVGMLIFQQLHGELQERIFGVLVVLLSARELILARRSDKESAPVGRVRAFLYVFSSGIIHGMYASGAPLLVYVVNKLNLDKSTFRSTLPVVWLTMNLILTVNYALTGKLTAETSRVSLMLLPSLILGLMLGEYLHRKSNGRLFKIVVFVLLLFSGFSIILK